MRQVTISESRPLKRTMRFKLEHVQLLPDLHFYERRMERGYTTDGTDFIERTFVSPEWLETGSPFGFPPSVTLAPFFPARRGGFYYDDGPGPDEVMGESGFVTTEGLEAVKAAGMKPLDPDPRLRRLGVIDKNSAERARNHGSNEVNFRMPTMKVWTKENPFDPEKDVFREMQAAENGYSHGYFYVRFDGSALPMALHVNLRCKEERHVTGHYGCYDEKALHAHLKAMEEANRLAFTHNFGSFRVTWRPRDQAEFDLVWNAAEQKDPAQLEPGIHVVATKNLWNALIALDILEIAQFKCAVPKKPEPKPEKGKKPKFKSRLYRVTNSLTGKAAHFFAKNPNGALDLAVHFKHVTEPDKSLIEDASDQFPLYPPVRAMLAGLIGNAGYANDGIKSGWEAMLDGKVTRIWDKDAQ